MSLRPIVSLGAGSMAEVVLGALDGGLVAVKIAHAATASDPALRALFEAEAAAAARLRHPALVPCLALTQRPLAMVLAYVHGPALAEVIDGAPLPSPTLALAILRDVAQGLAGLAEAGTFHGDLCPRNVLVDVAGRAWLTDFGAADAASVTSPFAGTAGYAAPEVARGARGDARSDLFSLGVLAWELLRGERLFAREGVAEAVRLVESVERPPPPVDAARPGLAPYVALCARLLAHDPAARGDVHDIVNMLDHIASTDDRASLGRHVSALFAPEAARREAARKAVAARYGDG